LLFALAVVLLIKPLVALLLMRALRQPLYTAVVVAIGLAQIGEFSFILIRQASDLKLLPEDSGHLVVAAAIVSISLICFSVACMAHRPSRRSCSVISTRLRRFPQRFQTNQQPEISRAGVFVLSLGKAEYVSHPIFYRVFYLLPIR
jgi:Kef-type K+ transport system membrane component KefB